MGTKKWVERRPSEEFQRLLNPDGSVAGTLPRVTRKELLRWYDIFARTRTFEDLTLKLQRRGVLSVTASSRGEEAVGLGVAAAMKAGDWCFPSYRQLSTHLYWNVPLARAMAGLMGNAPEHVREHLPVAPEDAPEVTFIPYAVFLGTNVPNAVGSALADKLNGRRHVTFAFVGEGTTSEGDFHDGLNFAGVLETPCVVIVQNNQWCISVPSARQTAAATYAQKAIAYGLPSERVDGNDLFAVYDAAKRAADRARSGKGATLIEAVTYRVLDHNTSDSSAVYRTEDEATYWQTLDPLERFERYLTSKGVLKEQDREAIWKRAETELREQIDRGRGVPPTPPQTMFLSHLHGDPGWSVRHQQAELDAELAGENPFVDFTGEGLR